MSSSAKFTRYQDGILVSGLLAVAAVAGQFVSIKNPAAAVNSVAEAPEFELATGRKAFSLLRDVLDATEVPLATLIFQDAGHLTPALVNQVVTARQILEGEFEGSDFLVLSGAQGLSTSTPVNSRLTYSGGKLALFTGGNVTKEVSGRNAAGAITLAGAAVGDIVKDVIKINSIETVSLGRNGAGAVTIAGARVGDKVRMVATAAGVNSVALFETVITVAGQIQQSSVSDLSAVRYTFNLETSASVAADFEGTITVAAQIQQSSAADLSAETLLVTIDKGNTQDATARLAGFLLPEDDGNTIRLLVEFNG